MDNLSKSVVAAAESADKVLSGIPRDTARMQRREIADLMLAASLSQMTLLGVIAAELDAIRTKKNV